MLQEEEVIKTLIDKFWPKVQKTDGCWLWIGAVTDTGYGYLSCQVPRRHNMRAHRISWELHNGAIPVGLNVLHRCDIPPCVRPDHLFLGTALDNNRDCISKGRRPKMVGQSRKTHCPQGHAYNLENTYFNKGKRYCRVCHREEVRRSRARAGL